MDEPIRPERISDTRVRPGSLWVVLADERRDNSRFREPGLDVWRNAVAIGSGINANEVLLTLRAGEVFLVEGVYRCPPTLISPSTTWVKLIEWGGYVNRVHFNGDSTGLTLVSG